MKIGFHASHEQFSPSELLRQVRLAEENGFQMVLSSDHFHPWSCEQGESGFAWSWLGAAMQATSLDFGIVNAPGQRYHPAIIAQAVATLLEMFPDRFWISVGSGQALNENITGEKWPSKEKRNERLFQSVEIMRKLWRGEKVTFEGLVKVESARLYSRSEQCPTVLGAAITAGTAAWLGGWADGLITISRPIDELNKVVSAFKNNGGQSKPLVLKLHVSYAETEEKALEGAWKQWRNNIFPSSVLTEMNTPEQFDQLGQHVRKEDMSNHIIIGTRAEVFIDAIREFSSLGFDTIVIHNVNKQQEEFISFFGKEVLPHLHRYE